MSKHLDFIKTSSGSERVIFKPNGKELGDCIQDIDGEYYFFPEPRDATNGAWAGYVLMEIGVHLSLLNTPMTAGKDRQQ